MFGGVGGFNTRGRGLEIVVATAAPGVVAVVVIGVVLVLVLVEEEVLVVVVDDCCSLPTTHYSLPTEATGTISGIGIILTNLFLSPI